MSPLSLGGLPTLPYADCVPHKPLVALAGFVSAALPPHVVQLQFTRSAHTRQILGCRISECPAVPEGAHPCGDTPAPAAFCVLASTL